MQLLIHGSQVIICGFQNSVGHGLSTQVNPFSFNLLFLPVQRAAYDELLGHDMDNGFRCSKATGNDVLLPGYFRNGSLDIFLVAVLAGVGVVDIFPDYRLGRDDLQSPDDFLADLGHGNSALGTHQILTLQTVFYPFFGKGCCPAYIRASCAVCGCYNGTFADSA